MLTNFYQFLCFTESRKKISQWKSLEDLVSSVTKIVINKFKVVGVEEKRCKLFEDQVSRFLELPVY